MYAEHKKLGATIVDFSGWEMPVQYTNVIDEHTTTRTKVGIFDICHMGEFIVSGKDALGFIQSLVTNDVNKLVDGKAQYACICREDGGTVDDLFIYRFNSDRFMIVVNAGNIEKDFKWLNSHVGEFDVKLEDESDKTAKIDIQGPLAEKALQKIVKAELSNLKRFSFVETQFIFGGEVFEAIISRTGYTGEDGFELYFDSKIAPDVWNVLLDAGTDEGIKPVGLGARDTLRVEACYSLYGHELSDSISPVEGGIGWVVRKDKGEFIGSLVLLKQKEEGTGRRNVAIEMIDRGIPRQGYKIVKDGKEIGKVSSGTMAPTLMKSIALAFVKFEFKEVGTEVEVIIRDKPYKAKIVKKPFYEFAGKS